MKVLICGERYSDNLGDGIIAFALEGLIRKIVPDGEVQFIDMSGRSGYRRGEVAKRGIVRQLHSRMYMSSRWYGTAMNRLVHRKRTRTGGRHAALAEAMVGADHLLIGGGQLLQDNRLAFPLAISDIIAQSQQNEVPVSLFSVGVGSDWSRFGKRVISQALSAPNVASIVCRDELSTERMLKLFPEVGAKVSTTYDVALTYEVDKTDLRKRGDAIGLGITHPGTIRWPVRNHPLASLQRARQFWIETCEALLDAGHTVQLFTNGAAADHAFALEINDSVIARRGPSSQVEVAPRPQTPGELVSLISCYPAIVTHRLHGNIVAAVLGVPSVALGWDAKLEQFMDYSGQSDRFIPAGDDSAQVVQRVNECLKTPLNANLMAPLIKHVEQSLEHVLLGRS